MCLNSSGNHFKIQAGNSWENFINYTSPRAGNEVSNIKAHE